MIRDIVFDLGNVLLRVNRPTVYERLTPYLPRDRARLLREDPKAFERLFHSSIAELETGRITFDRFQDQVEEILGMHMDPEEFRFAYCDAFSLDAEMVRLGKALSVRYRTWLASNTSEADYRYILESFPQVSFYRSAALSYKLGVMKPARAYFERTIEQFGIEPKSAIFIDDLEANVQAAMQVGLHGIVFKGYPSLLVELERLGVKPCNDGDGE
ncbi:MAG: HAD family phosphatase [Thermodesulfobacteriota bacterium]